MIIAAMMGGGAALWPWKAAFAESGAGLMRLPKQALVIGNSKYKHAPLKNPINDAQGMAEALKSAGFGVTVGLELTQAGLRDAIRTYSESLAKTKAIGLFYFAGHGAQLAWRNYLIPVDAEIDNVQELRDRGVDVNSLMEGITRAGNPMNVIILDACRNNPFGSSSRLDQKGLSQLDAPPGTLLAYATAPGNTAIDGDGENGLYTEHLLREIKVPEAKVEDMFKRVRLGVRRQSKGLQVPWESTSLEEDFWFIPPKEIKKLAEEEVERAFKQELEVWERIQHAVQAEPLEDYLRRYPSGRFVELAQLRLDQVLLKQGESKVEIVPAPQNPYSKGTSRTDTAFKVGDRYTYRRVDVLSKLEVNRPYTNRVTDITENEVIYNNGNKVTDLLGNNRKFARSIWTVNQTVPAEFVIGKRWNTRFQIIEAGGRDSTVDLELRVADREQVSVPAGTFNAFRVEARGWRTGSGINNAWDLKTWFAPDQLRSPVAFEWFNRKMPAGTLVTTQRDELVEFRQR